MAKLPREPSFEESAPVSISSKEKKRPPVIYLQIPSEEVDGVEIDDKVTVTIRGKVVGVDQHKMMSQKRKTTRANIDIEDPSITVKTGSTQMEDLDEDMDA